MLEGIDFAGAFCFGDDEAAVDGVFDALAGHAAAGKLGLVGEAAEFGVDVLGDGGGNVDGLAAGAVVARLFRAFHKDRISVAERFFKFLARFSCQEVTSMG